jgi:crotonobetainyl-CoA:carnitine CoA-transferase CaiB-like acyl-CoA transferase
MAGPLAGVKVLEFTQIIAGPFCGMHLADMGADVIKFEPPEGEPWRLFVQLVPKESRTFLSLNRGKRGVAMDLRRPEAQAIVQEMAKTADVVVINYRPGAAKRMGIDYETLSAINPRIIYCENTAFGRFGPLSHLGGYDIVVQSLTGLMAGEAKMEGNVPGYIYPAVADYATGIQMSNAICAALYAREKTGKGQRLDCTLLGTALAMQTSQFTWIDAFDDAIYPAMLGEIEGARAEQKRFPEQLAIHRKYRPAASGNVYYRVYQTLDGFVTVGALSDVLRNGMIAATGIADPRQQADGTWNLALVPPPEKAAEMVAAAETLFLTKTTADWIEILSAKNVPCGPLHFVEELFEHEQTAANGLVTEMEHPLLGHFRMVGAPFQMSETPLEPREPSPMLGEDTDAVLAEYGVSDERVAALRSAGVIR